LMHRGQGQMQPWLLHPLLINVINISRKSYVLFPRAKQQYEVCTRTGA
jgi:hypothetical protein